MSVKCLFISSNKIISSNIIYKIVLKYAKIMQISLNTDL